MYTKTTAGAQQENFRIAEDGGIFFGNLLAAAASTDVNINGSNELHSVTSSAEFKEGVRSLEVDTSKIYDLEVKTFDWGENTGSAGEEDFNLIAEEAYATFPEIVALRRDRKAVDTATEGEGNIKREWQEVGDPKPYSIRNPALIASMLVELQKLKAEVDALKVA